MDNKCMAMRNIHSVIKSSELLSKCWSVRTKNLSSLIKENYTYSKYNIPIAELCHEILALHKQMIAFKEKTVMITFTQLTNCAIVIYGYHMNAFFISTNSLLMGINNYYYHQNFDINCSQKYSQLHKSSKVQHKSKLKRMIIQTVIYEELENITIRDENEYKEIPCSFEECATKSILDNFGEPIIEQEIKENDDEGSLDNISIIRQRLNQLNNSFYGYNCSKGKNDEQQAIEDSAFDMVNCDITNNNLQNPIPHENENERNIECISNTYRNESPILKSQLTGAIDRPPTIINPSNNVHEEFEMIQEFSGFSQAECLENINNHISQISSLNKKPLTNGIRRNVKRKKQIKIRTNERYEIEKVFKEPIRIEPNITDNIVLENANINYIELGRSEIINIHHDIEFDENFSDLIANIENQSIIENLSNTILQQNNAKKKNVCDQKSTNRMLSLDCSVNLQDISILLNNNNSNAAAFPQPILQNDQQLVQHLEIDNFIPIPPQLTEFIEPMEVPQPQQPPTQPGVPIVTQSQMENILNKIELRSEFENEVLKKLINLWIKKVYPIGMKELILDNVDRKYIVGLFSLLLEMHKHSRNLLQISNQEHSNEILHIGPGDKINVVLKQFI